MLRTVRGLIDPDGRVRLLEPLALTGSEQVLVTVLDEEATGQGNTAPDAAVLAESALRDWDRPEEDEAWQSLQPEQ
jgi:hypothetical protein